MCSLRAVTLQVHLILFKIYNKKKFIFIPGLASILHVYCRLGVMDLFNANANANKLMQIN